MNGTNQSEHPDVRRALRELRGGTVKSLRAFNASVPYDSWLRRSEIERFADDLLWATERAPRRRRPTLFGMIKNSLSWIIRVRTAARFT